MNSRTFARMTGSSLIVLSSMVACSGAKMERRPALASDQAPAIASNIENALAHHDFARAQLDAERLVAASPREASYRTLLGRAYLANGRYRSAETAFDDAMTLGANDIRTIVSLALVRTALGNQDGARELLSAHISDLPAGDYGLAMAMAGDAQEGVRALLEAVHQPEADAKARQNLAYALALSGNWGQARLVAGQDLSGSDVQKRMAQWSQNAAPDAYSQRVASLVGVSPRSDDSGLPAQLALAASEPTALASATGDAPDDLVQQAIADSGGTPLLPAAPAPAPVQRASTQETEWQVADSRASVPANATTTAPIIAAPQGPVRIPIASSQTTVATKPNGTKPAPRAVVAQVTKPAATQPSAFTTGRPQGHSAWVVQIGAYSDAGRAKLGWQRALARTAHIGSYDKIASNVHVNGKMFYRVAMSGFSGQDAARSFCASLQTLGQSCFVRQDSSLAADQRLARGKSGGVPQTASLHAKGSARLAKSAPAATAKPASIALK